MHPFRMFYDERYDLGHPGRYDVNAMVHRDLSWQVADGAHIEFLSPGGKPRVTVRSVGLGYQHALEIKLRGWSPTDLDDAAARVVLILTARKITEMCAAEWSLASVTPAPLTESELDYVRANPEFLSRNTIDLSTPEFAAALTANGPRYRSLPNPSELFARHFTAPFYDSWVDLRSPFVSDDARAMAAWAQNHDEVANRGFGVFDLMEGSGYIDAWFDGDRYMGESFEPDDGFLWLSEVRGTVRTVSAAFVLLRVCGRIDPRGKRQAEQGLLRLIGLLDEHDGLVRQLADLRSWDVSWSDGDAHRRRLENEEVAPAHDLPAVTQWTEDLPVPHPAFIAHARSAVYDDFGSEFAPFGSDEGFDAIHNLYDRLPTLPPGFTLREVVGADWPVLLDGIAGAIDEILNAAPHLIGYGFAILRSTGRIDPEGREVVLRALRGMLSAEPGAAELGQLIADLDAWPT